MLKVEIKSKRNTSFDLKVRYHINQNAKVCSCLYSFEYSFLEDLKKYPKEWVAPISNLYVTENDGNEVRVYHNSPSKGKDRLIAIITMEREQTSD